jgi:hypothetical protein
VALGTTCALIVAEVTLRVLNVGYGYSDEDSDPIFHHVHAKNYTFISYDPNGEWNAGRVHYDENGFVSGADHYTDNDAPCRIAFLGDSFTEARQVPYAASFVGRLASISKCAIRNYGVSSYSPVLYLLQWQKIVQFTKPDLVILQLYSNDIGDEGDAGYARVAKYDSKGHIVAVPGPQTMGSWSEFPRIIARQSYLMRLVRRDALVISWWLKSKPDSLRAVGPSVEEFPTISRLTSDTMKELSSEVSANGSTFVFFVVPSKYRLTYPKRASEVPEFSDEWKGWGADNDVHFIDMVPAFQRQAQLGRTLFFQRDVHFNALGHHVVAQEICKSYPKFFDPRGCAALIGNNP